MNRLVIVRHGETVWHAENRYAGRSDIALNEAGELQAEALAHWAAGAGLSAVWSSPLLRARLTAAPCAKSAGLPLLIEPALAELDFGAGEGLTRAEMQERFPAEHSAFEQDPARHPLPQGESPAEAVTRGVEALQRISETIAGERRTLVVAHSTLIRLMLCRLLEISISRYREIFPQLANIALTELAFTPRGAALLSFNVPVNPLF